jgi:hypothetical protein
MLAPLQPAEVQVVVGYAQGLQADDSLVQVRSGVFAKHSNVYGVAVGPRRVYYDVMPHQSFGPLRSGKLDESEVTILHREVAGDTMVVVYVPKG